MKTITFRSEQKSRGCAEFGPSHLVYTDTVCEDGTVRWSVKGTCDGEYVNASGERMAEIPAPLDLESVKRARLSSGWTVVE